MELKYLELDDEGHVRAFFISGKAREFKKSCKELMQNGV